MSCEKCWRDANGRHFSKQSESVTFEYMKLLEERKDNPCTPEEQCGEMHTMAFYTEDTVLIHCACGQRSARIEKELP